MNIYKAFRILLIKDFPTPCKRKRKRFWKIVRRYQKAKVLRGRMRKRMRGRGARKNKNKDIRGNENGE